MEIRITAIRARADGAGIILTVVLLGNGGKETRYLSLSEEQYLSFHPTKGLISTEQFDALSAASSLNRAIWSGYRMLGYGARSEKELAQRLRRKGIDSEDAEAAVAVLSDKGYIRENEDAVREADKDLRKNWSRRRIVAHLQAKGYGEQAMGAVSEFLEEVDFSEVCRKYILAHFRLEQMDDDGVKKMMASLMRSGFPISQVREALLKIREEQV